ncbi:baeRF6 domain-containing protein [Tissierella creatinophila]|uniref:Bacterial archaeo-eukaryotic release factor family 6 domain-containing protein n=1 Tax=Tissierella creatinophila DSM 6911 TaxID=1123403 RepID=A0A1U7M8I9_TISCR|nr:hypothetical protein [Tissierella creatinophila]OLS03643.1 hypothetical protein TICRE_03390 [Tissierella creatinophila DSM 6911]
MYEIVKDFPNKIIFEKEGPFMSLYQPTHKSRPENMQDPIRFKNLVQQLENSLKKGYPEQVDKLMKPFYDIAEDKIFWNNTSEGLVVLANKNKCVVYKLNRSVDELAIVANSFHIKPLIRNFQSADNYHVLGITRNDFNIYEGNRYGIEMIDLDKDTPKTLEEVLGDEYTQSHINTGRYSGGVTGSPVFHGHGGRKDEVEIDTERYFRYIDKFILENFSNEMKLPLILVALDEHQGEFRNITKNKYLLDEKVSKDPEALAREEIKELTWNKMETLYIQKTKDLVDRYGLQSSKFLGTDDLAEIARAALEGRIDTLMIESGHIEPGMVNRQTGEIERGNLDNPEFDDILDDLGEMALKSQSEVVVLPKERMPSNRGIAAIFRY